MRRRLCGCARDCPSAGSNWHPPGTPPPPPPPNTPVSSSGGGDGWVSSYGFLGMSDCDPCWGVRHRGAHCRPAFVSSFLPLSRAMLLHPAQLSVHTPSFFSL